MEKPNFFIVGAPKCGTTSLYTYLKEHPDIFMPERKEPHHFGSDLRRRRFGTYWHMENEDDYLTLFEEAHGQKRVGEASTLYLASKKAAEEIYRFNPEPKIIIMLRSPVDVMYSLYYELRHRGHERMPTFEKALAMEEEREHHQLDTEGGFFVETLLYRNRVQFSQQVERYFNVFGREPVRVIIFDDFKRDTAKVFHDTLVFLDVDPDFETNLKRVNPNKIPRSMVLRDFLRKPPRPVLTIGKAVFPVARPIYRGLRRLNTRYMPRESMNPETRKRLQAEFLPDVERLSELLGRDLTHWCRS